MSKMISSTTTIQVVLSSAVTTNQLPCTASWMDQGGLGGDSTANTNSTTAVTLVTAPAASVERLVTDLSICNTDTANATVTINKVVSGTPSEWAKFLLPPGYRASYDGHWRVMDPNGNFCETVTVTSGTLTVNQGAANATPWNENIAQYGGTATSLGQKVSASSVPVVIASDQSSVSVLPAPMQGCAYLSLTTMANTAITTTTGSASSASSRIRAIVIDLVGFTVAGAVNIRIFDGSNNQVWQHTFPATGTSTTTYGVYSMSDLNIPLANTGTAPYVNLTTATTTGYIGISVLLS